MRGSRSFRVPQNVIGNMPAPKDSQNLLSLIDVNFSYLSMFCCFIMFYICYILNIICIFVILNLNI